MPVDPDSQGFLQDAPLELLSTPDWVISGKCWLAAKRSLGVSPAVREERGNSWSFRMRAFLRGWAHPGVGNNFCSCTAVRVLASKDYNVGETRKGQRGRLLMKVGLRSRVNAKD
jgi:hypothetical protein